MANIGGFDIPISVDISGFLSSSWVYVLIVVLLGVAAIIVVGLLLFYKTYNKKVILFDNISGAGYQPVLKTRARTIKLDIGGEEILKTLFGGKYLTAYGRKMGKNTYWFAKGEDGYYYNVILSDLDSKKGVLDIDPVVSDVRMFHVTLNRLSQLQYGSRSFLEKYGVHIILFFFLVALVFGMWIIVGKVEDATKALSSTAKTNEKVAQTNMQTISAVANLITTLSEINSTITNIPLQSSGIKPINLSG